MDCTQTNPSTHTLESLLGVLHSKMAADAPADGVQTTTDYVQHAALLQKLDSIERACASLDILHQKVDSLCVGMQLIRTELEVADAQPAYSMPPRADYTAAPDCVTITVREDGALASCATTPAGDVDSTATTTPTTITTPVVSVAHEPDSTYKNPTDILNVLWPGLPNNEQDVSHCNRIRQESELAQEAD